MSDLPEDITKITERNKRLPSQNPYGEAAIKAATEGAGRLAELFGRHKGVVDVREGIYHGGVEIHVWFLTKDYMNEMNTLIPHDFEGFFVRRHAPFWAIGELSTQYRQKVLDFGVVVYGTQEQRDQDAFYEFVMREEEKKWTMMTSIQRRKFVDALVASRRIKG